jgi:hypothetical protein
VHQHRSATGQIRGLSDYVHDLRDPGIVFAFRLNDLSEDVQIRHVAIRSVAGFLLL